MYSYFDKFQVYWFLLLAGAVVHALHLRFAYFKPGDGDMSMHKRVMATLKIVASIINVSR